MSRDHPVNRLNPIVHAFSFCPRCRGDMHLVPEGGKQRPTCRNCGFVQYLSPAPGVAVIIFREDRVCLVRRRFEPKQGEWTLAAEALKRATAGRNAKAYMYNNLGIALERLDEVEEALAAYREGLSRGSGVAGQNFVRLEKELGLDETASHDDDHDAPSES